MRRELPRESRRLLDAAITVARARAEPLWLVGGAVRDCAAGLPLGDVDVAVEDAPATMAAAVAAPLGATVRRHPEFGTAAVRLGAWELDVAWLRSERYARPGALPTVASGATIEEDLARRDFSVNAVALGLAGPRRGELVDPFGGLPDLAARRLRVLHRRSFIDDATRLWRGARYAARLRLRPDAESEALIEAGGRWLARISGRRLWAEFERTARERRAGAALRLLEDWGALRGTARGLALTPAAERALRHRPGPHDPAVLLAVLLAPLPARDPIAARLRPPREARRAVTDAVRLLALSDEAPASMEEVERTGAAGRTAALWLDRQRQRPLQRSLRRWQRTRPHLDAEALVRLGVERGPALGRMLSGLRRGRYLGTLSSAADARRFVWRALREGAGP